MEHSLAEFNTLLYRDMREYLLLKVKTLGGATTKAHFTALYRNYLDTTRHKDNREGSSPRIHSAPDRWKVQDQLGTEGKEGIVYRVVDAGGTQCAMKQFKPKKSRHTFDQEVEMQRKASVAGAAPEVVDVIYTKPLRLVMEKMTGTVVEYLAQNGGILTEQQQYNILDVHDRLDKAGIYHNDPNPLNLLYQTLSDGSIRWKLIDYGFSIPIHPSKHGHRPNREAIDWLLNASFQGLCATGKLKEIPTLLIAATLSDCDVTFSQSVDFVDETGQPPESPGWFDGIRTLSPWNWIFRG